MCCVRVEMGWRGLIGNIVFNREQTAEQQETVFPLTASLVCLFYRGPSPSHSGLGGKTVWALNSMIIY